MGRLHLVEGGTPKNMSFFSHWGSRTGMVYGRRQLSLPKIEIKLRLFLQKIESLERKKNC